ncbi:hypothetical protein [Acinetobacter courvalinii]|uniref:DUF2750 domain-containing protein n=1 Tax=Acinetobacter courvalinii TaxID=280147 RepID=A0AA42I4F5_9GAMM|nr:hypothetical protein [Acinetobacter courvalinii]MDH0562186.1 hypothetical protein [Acinetobacter courvalinii]
MNAIEFIQQHGVEKAREVVSGAPEWAIFWITQGEYHISMLSFPNMTGHHSFIISDLKRIVESVDLIRCFNNLEQAKLWLADLDDDVSCIFSANTHGKKFQKHELKQAIADYEAIYSEQVK